MNDILYAFTHFGQYPWASMTLVFMFVLYAVILILQLLRKKNVLIISITAGLAIGIYYLIVSSMLEPSMVDGIDNTQTLVDSIYIWLTIAWTIFMLLLLAVLPIYIFTMVSTTFTNARHHQGGRKLITTSFLSLWGMTLLGIAVALLLSPLMWLTKDWLQVNEGLAGQESTGIFGGIWPELEKAINKLLINYGIIVLISIALALIFAVIMNLLHSRLHDHGERVIGFLEKIKEAMQHLLHGVSHLVPYVISGMVIVIFANYQGAFLGTLGLLLLFTGFFFLGLSIVWGLEYSIVYTLRPNKETMDNKELKRKTIDYSINDFAVQSAPILFPVTVQYVKDLGVNEAVADTTPTLSTFMGYSMCGGFYPSLIVIFTLLQSNPTINESFNMTMLWALLIISVMVPLILVMTLGMTGVPGADVAIILGLLSTLGLSPNYFFTIYLIEPMLDKFRGIGNSMGFAAASVITNKVYEKELAKEDKR